MSHIITKEIKRGTAREAILEVASDLFYVQGYNATGIQQIIDGAGVSKGTFYTHYRSKEELGVAYLRKLHNEEMIQFKALLGAVVDPRDRVLAFNQLIKDWFVETEYRGCAFAHMTAEVTDINSPIRTEAKVHYESFNAIIRKMIEDYIEADVLRADLDLESISHGFMLVIIGAIINAEIYHDTWPFNESEKLLRKLLGVE